MDDNERYLDLLTVFHYVYGALVGLFACVPILHVAMGMFMLISGDGPALMGVFFLVLGGVFVVMGWAMAVAIIMAGRKIKARESRIFCIVVAAIMCAMFPFGTALGVFTLIMLTKDEVVGMFDNGGGEYGAYRTMGGPPPRRGV